MANVMSLFAMLVVILLLDDLFHVKAERNRLSSDIITVIKNIQKDLKQLTDYVHQRDEKTDRRLSVIENDIQDIKKEAGFFTRKLLTADDVISAKSSSVYQGIRENWGPQYAWRGRSTTDRHYFHSANESKPWLLIRIPRVQLFSVTIIVRKDCCGQELRNLQVRAGLLQGLTNEVVGTFQGPAVTGKEYVIQFHKGVAVEYISFQKMEVGRLMINGIKVNEDM